VVDNVLDLAGIEAGHVEIHSRSFCPRSLVTEVAEMFRLQIEESGGHVSCTFDQSVPDLLLGDAQRIQQVLVNYTANASRYAKGSHVRLSVRRRDDGTGRYIFTVADDGPGIAPGDLEHIFERFGRSQDRARQNGHGVGLSLVRKLANLLGGEADVDSTLGAGSKFRLTIPLKTSDAPDRKATPPGRASAAKPLRTLVVDDQSFNRLVLRDHLEQMQCQVEEAADLQTASLLIKTRPPQIAFIDLNLPVGNGIELIKQIRSNPLLRDVFLVATTADSTSTNEKAALAAGAHAFLPKPITIPNLGTLLETYPNLNVGQLAQPPSTPRKFSDMITTPERSQKLKDELSEEIGALVNAWHGTDLDNARQRAHRLASLALLAGDESLVAAARNTEQAIRQARPDASQAISDLVASARGRLEKLRHQARLYPA
jgi:CheY-like chemotaxis protein